ncbi:MAG: PhnD/SsuA/transferrin family substrate-binding protein [Candidatus Kapabacteria bacterium]|jgi:phosphate/phosphite/phosphonate ABC transporter binding protein|nr:PhnD/SsuA/transferrin family substrate-binding protein [Candidatus Kapabacteria bacterium]
MRTVRYFLTFILVLILFDSSDCLSQADDSKKFRMAVIKYKTVEEVKETYTPMVNYIAKKLGKQPELTIIMDESLAYDLSDDKFDLGVFPPFPYLKAKTDFPELEVFASHIVSGKKTYKGAIYVLESSGIESFMDLKDKNFLFVKPTSTSGFKYPKGILREHNIDIDEFFNYDFSGGHDESITALLEGKAEGIAIDTKAYKRLSPEDKIRIKILKEYEIPYHAYVLSPNLDEKISKQITKIFLIAKKNPATAKMFENVLNIEKWVDCDDEHYNPLRRYLGIVRVKPQMNVILTIKESAQKDLEKKDDIITIIEDEIIHELKDEKRFSDEIGEQKFERNYYELEVVLSLMDGEYHYQVHLNDNRIAKGDISYKNLSKLLPEIIVSSVLPIPVKVPTNSGAKSPGVPLKVPGLNRTDIIS